MCVCVQKSDEDVSQFDSIFTRQTPVDSPDDTSLSHGAQQAFAVSPAARLAAILALNARHYCCV